MSRILATGGVLCLMLMLMGSSGEALPAPTGTVTVSDTIALLREFGFPVFVAVWFMWRIEKRLDRFTEQIEKLITVVTVMTKVVDER